MATPNTLLDGSRSRADAPRELLLLVTGPGVFSAFPLPAGGQVVVGRGQDADVRLEDGKASRRHARFHVGAGGEVELEDLGSANGTRVRERRLQPKMRVKVAPGEAIAIGGLVLMVQSERPAAAGAARALLSHAELEGKVEWECARAEATGGVFSVARVRTDPASDNKTTLRAAMAALRPGDAVGRYGPGDHGLLMPGLAATAAKAQASAFANRLPPGDETARVAIASYPDDGRNAAALLARAATGLFHGGPYVAVDDNMRRVEALAARAAAGDIPVLILGETGSGKEVLAQTVHGCSPRAARPMACINCAALTDTLVENELFGHERGAFTGAVDAKPGLLETAAGGTVFLDEIGELPPGQQAKLLRVIETREFTRVGGVRARKLDVRFIAATHRDLDAEVARGTFRSDLYYRLNGMTLIVPPLRERRRDIPVLARAFVAAFARDTRTPPKDISPTAMDALTESNWPGNIRQLRHVIERAMLLCEGSTILSEHLPASHAANVVRPAQPTATPDEPASERSRILAALAACGGNQSRAARALGISRKVLIARLDSYGVARPRKQGKP